ncbi:protein of unknown function [Nitrospira japonica]|uniref:Right handed beta helix domain-containing protein n=1 Tax=Nitrospira japonica TaxID=1325564 RepID=A0A1W1IAE3_9BACT|nr:right-handed parallel beta-helix repeat-containing protein [Nitrospira japonica]SLM49962.1 protein of unknown function [Nitrospira japonica]
MHNPSFTNEPCSHRARYFQMNVTPWLEESKRSHLTRIARLGCIRVFVLGVTLFAGTIAEAATYYVATNGSDSRTCGVATNASNAKRTIGSAVGCLMPGDTLYIAGGTYVERLDSNSMTIPAGTSWTQAVKIAASPGQVVTMRPGAGPAVVNLAHPYIQYVIFDGIIFDGSNTGSDVIGLNGGAHHVRFANSEIKNGRYNGIILSFNYNGAARFNEFINLKVHDNGYTNGVPDDYFHGFYITTDSNLIDGCEVYNNAGNGGKFYDTPSGNVFNNVVRNSIFHDNSKDLDPDRWSAGFFTSSGTGNQIYNNIAYNNYIGFAVLRGGNGNILYNNISYANEIAGINIDAANGSLTGAKVYNNTIVNNGRFGILLSNAPTDTAITNNIVYQNPTNIYSDGTDKRTVLKTNLLVDPKFKNAAARNFSLQTGSPAIDAGTALSEVTTDFSKVQRPQGSSYDIGAFEGGDGPTADTTPPLPPTNVQLF